MQTRSGTRRIAKAYWIGRIDVHNRDGCQHYAAANPAIIKKFGGRFVVRSGNFEGVEGQSRAHNVVIEFADYGDGLLSLAGIPGEHQAADAAFARRVRHRRRL